MAVPGVERLARRCFEAGREPDFPRRYKELLHPDVVVRPKELDGETIEGREAVGAYLARRGASGVYEAVDERYRVLDDERVIAEGRLRWMDEERRLLRDDPAIWAFQFRDGLLYRSLAARSMPEAEALLAVRR